jgi:drug/metabolite transporter (DMT)-like permease
MAILLAYFSVVLIWATTPLAIQWSSDSLSFIAAASLRMSFALALGLLINMLLSRKLFSSAQVWRAYAAGAISVFPNMPVVYWSAQYIPSGLIAVIFAMSPFVTGLMTMVLLKQNPFSLRRVLALLMALFGLVIIFYNQLQMNIHTLYGMVGILFSCFLFSFSSVLVKKVNSQVDAFNQMLGSLLFALPGLLISWWLLDGYIPTLISTKSWAAVGYLAILGSLLGITLFFYVLANMTATAVSMITFMTPIIALMLGAVLANESLGWQVWLGAILVIMSLLFYLDLSINEILLKALQRSAWPEDQLQLLKNAFNKSK